MSGNPKTEDVVIQAPFSFVGSAKRVFKLTRTDNALLKWLLFVLIAIILTFIAWVFVRIEKLFIVL